MRFKVKTNNTEVLKKYGFKLPEEWLANGALDGTNVSEGCLIDGCFYMFGMDEEDPSKIAVESTGNPIIEGWIDTREGRNTIWFDVEPYGTCHIGMYDLLPMIDVVYQLTMDGLLERIDEE